MTLSKLKWPPTFGDKKVTVIESPVLCQIHGIKRCKLLFYTISVWCESTILMRLLLPLSPSRSIHPSFLPSFARSFVLSFLPSFLPSLPSFVHSFIHSFTHSLVSLIHPHPSSQTSVLPPIQHPNPSNKNTPNINITNPGNLKGPPPHCHPPKE